MSTINKINVGGINYDIQDTWRPVTVGNTTISDNSDSITIVGSGATSVSLNASTNTLTISSTDNNTTYSVASNSPLSMTGTVIAISVGDGANQVAAGNHTHSYASITDKPTLATVATTGSYNDLDNKPTIPSVDSALSSTSTNPVQNKAIYSALGNKADTSSLATVATTGSYNDLDNKPTIPAAYTLPKATSNVLGGVQIGDNISVNSSTGKISVGTASTDSFGVVKIGNGINVTNGVISVSGSSGGGGTTYTAGTGINIDGDNVISSTAGTQVVTVDSDSSVKISLQAVTNLNPDYAGDTRGNGAVDLQQYRANDSTVASGDYSVAMGYSNTASGPYSVAMGQFNTTCAVNSFIGGGRYNVTVGSAQNSFIGGGYYNTALAANSAILSGAYNNTAHEYSVVCGQHCYNPFPSTAINRLGNMNSLPSGVFGHSGKLSVTVNGGSQVELMRFTKFIFSGILKLHYVIYLPYTVALVEKTIYIADNNVVYESIDHSYGSPTRFSGGILNRVLYSDGWANAIMYQVGVDYTCLCENNGGDGYYDYY